MSLYRVLSLLLLGSGVSFAAGGMLLYYYELVPFTLTFLTVVAVAIALALSYFVSRGSKVAANTGAILGFAAIVFSVSSSAHTAALEKFGSSTLLTILDVLQVLGFYVFPAAYILLLATVRKKI